MRSINFYMLIVALLALVGCSDNEIPGDPGNKGVIYDATLSLAIKNPGVKMKASGVDPTAVSANDPSAIHRLTAVVFQGDIQVAFKDSIDVSSSQSGISGLEEIKIPAGILKLYMFANLTDADKTSVSGAASPTALEALSISLNDEKSGNLRMSSNQLNITANPGRNYYGYSAVSDGAIISQDSIPMKRFISRVHLSSIALKLSDNFGGSSTPATFKLDTMFFSNLKGNATLADASENNGTNLVWIDGAFNSTTGQYKTITTASATNSRRYDFNNAPSSLASMQNLYAFDNAYEYSGGIIIDGNNITLSNTNMPYTSPKAKSSHVGMYTYTYENTNAQNPTVLVVQGDLTLTLNGVPVLYKDRFYTVPVNFEYTSSYDGVTSHNYIKRNNIYDIKLTISGPGSDKPYDKMPTAAINAQVTVKNWNVVNQHENVD